jgi:TRAP-type transport system periplasmic protein
MTKTLITICSVLSFIVIFKSMGGFGSFSPITNPTTKPSENTGQSIYMIYDCPYPTTEPGYQLVQKFCDELKARSNGQLIVTPNAPTATSPGKNWFNLMQNGRTEMCMSLLPVSDSSFASYDYLRLPQGYKDGWIASNIANSYFQQLKPTELDKIHVLYCFATSPNNVLTATKNLVTDISGLKMRTSDTLNSEVIKLLGGSPVSLAIPDVYIALQNSSIDGVYGPRSSLDYYKWREVVNSIVNFNEVGTISIGIVGINKARWEQLPDNLKNLLSNMSTEWINYHGILEKYLATNATKNFPGFVLDLTDTARAFWIDKNNSVVDNYVKQHFANDPKIQGYKQKIAELLTSFSNKTPGDEACTNWVETNLKKK